MDLGLTGKHALVVGASRGIGRAIVRVLHAEGALVAAVARGQQDLDELARNVPCHTIVADVSTAVGASNAIDEALAKLGQIDLVIANVGKSFARHADQMDDDDFAKSLDLNLWTAARIAQRAAPHLPDGGSITMTSSVWGKEAGGAPGYNVAKAGVIALAKALARDYAPRGIRVNAVAPGSILFPGGGWDRRQQTDPVAIAAFVERDLPLGRFGRVEEVADVVAFVASPRASLVTGACIAVDGAQSRSF